MKTARVQQVPEQWANSARWLAAGEEVEVTQQDWEAGERSDRFFVYVKVLGRDEEFRRAVTVREEAATLPDLPPGSDVLVCVVAANDAGESAPSAEVRVKIPVANNNAGASVSGEEGKAAAPDNAKVA